MKRCICGRDKKKRGYTGAEVAIGLGIYAVAAALLLVAVGIGFWPYLLGLVTVVIVIFAMYNRAAGHRLWCSLRKAALDFAAEGIEVFPLGW